MRTEVWCTGIDASLLREKHREENARKIPIDCIIKVYTCGGCGTTRTTKQNPPKSVLRN